MRRTTEEIEQHVTWCAKTSAIQQTLAFPAQNLLVENAAQLLAENKELSALYRELLVSIEEKRLSEKFPEENRPASIDSILTDAVEMAESCEDLVAVARVRLDYERFRFQVFLADNQLQLQQTETETDNGE